MRLGGYKRSKPLQGLARHSLKRCGLVLVYYMTTDAFVLPEDTIKREV